MLSFIFGLGGLLFLVGILDYFIDRRRRKFAWLLMIVGILVVIAAFVLLSGMLSK